MNFHRGYYQPPQPPPQPPPRASAATPSPTPPAVISALCTQLRDYIILGIIVLLEAFIVYMAYTDFTSFRCALALAGFIAFSAFLSAVLEAIQQVSTFTLIAQTYSIIQPLEHADNIPFSAQLSVIEFTFLIFWIYVYRWRYFLLTALAPALVIHAVLYKLYADALLQHSLGLLCLGGAHLMYWIVQWVPECCAQLLQDDDPPYRPQYRYHNPRGGIPSPLPSANHRHYQSSQQQHQQPHRHQHSHHQRPDPPPMNRYEQQQAFQDNLMRQEQQYQRQQQEVAQKQELYQQQRRAQQAQQPRPQPQPTQPTQPTHQRFNHNHDNATFRAPPVPQQPRPQPQPTPRHNPFG